MITFMNEIIIQKTIDFVKAELSNAEKGHDFWHIYRVLELSKHIAVNEKVDLFVVELGALLHDIADSKFHDGDETIGPNKARSFLELNNVDEKVINHVIKIIENISFKCSFEEQKFKSPELDVVMDADRLDGMGAIGIARTFSFGGYFNRELYNPNIKPKLNMGKNEYKNNQGTSINHFYEKLLLLKDKMNTNTGKELAKERHEFMEKYLKEFYLEWDGKK
jgi:uncharacterized protein